MSDKKKCKSGREAIAASTRANFFNGKCEI